MTSPLDIARALSVSDLPLDAEGGLWLNAATRVSNPQQMLRGLRADLEASRPRSAARRAALNRLRMVLLAIKEAEAEVPA